MSTKLLKGLSRFAKRLSDIQSILKMESLKILITSVTGMAGSRIVDYVLNNHRDIEVDAVLHWGVSSNSINHIKR